MNPLVEKLTAARDQLDALCGELRRYKDDTPEAFKSWYHACQAHTQISMALDAGTAAAADAERDRIAGQ